MTCLPSRPSHSTPDPQIHGFFITNSFFLYLYYQWPWRKSPAAFHSVQLKLLCSGPGDGKRGCRVRHWTSSPAAAHTRLQAVLVAGSALEGFEGIREAVAKHGHLAAMAHWARDEGEVAAGLARPGMLYPLKKQRESFHTVVFYLPKAWIVWEKPTRFEFGRWIW